MERRCHRGSRLLRRLRDASGQLRRHAAALRGERAAGIRRLASRKRGDLHRACRDARYKRSWSHRVHHDALRQRHGALRQRGRIARASRPGAVRHRAQPRQDHHRVRGHLPAVAGRTDDLLPAGDYSDRRLNGEDLPSDIRRRARRIRAGRRACGKTRKQLRPQGEKHAHDAGNTRKERRQNMLASFANAFKVPELRGKILFTITILALYRLGAYIPVPGIPFHAFADAFQGNGVAMVMLDLFTGGALSNFSVFALGIMPYITASIIIQLLQMDIIPYLTELSKQGATGRKKINQITRYLGIAFAFIEGYAFAFAFIGKSGDVFEYLYIATILTAGTAFLLWLGDQITQKGIGNGISLIIMAGIIATLPQMFIDAFTGLVVFDGTAQVITLGIIKFILFVIIYFAIVIGIIFVQESERRVPIQYANKSTSAYANSAQSFMPIKINSAGVIPVIFASSLLTIPGILAQVIKNETFTLVVEKYLTYTTPVGFLIYVILIFFFAYFYTFIQLKPEEFAKNLQENGGYIPGIRPGEETKKHISKILSRLTILGATFLVVIAGLPILFSKVTSLPTSVSIGGTGLLIVVGVALETYKQLEGSILTRSYKRGYSRR